MNIITMLDAATVNFQKSAASNTVSFEAYRPYVVSSLQLSQLQKDAHMAQLIFRVTALEPRVQNFHVQIPKKPGSKRILVYNGSGGYGDQIMTWPFAKILDHLGYEVHVLCDPGNQTCWWYFPWVKSISMVPLQYELFKLFDYYALFQNVCQFDEEPDQNHPVDRMLNAVGVDPTNIPPQMKVVEPVFTSSETSKADQMFPGVEIAMYQLAATSHIRSLNPDDSAFMFKKLAEAFPQYHWLALYDDFVPTVYSERASELTQGMTNVTMHKSPALRLLWALTRRARVVVGPDSMMAHIAGSLDVPCVGLWGPTDPSNRVAYYRRHARIWNREVCPAAPCNTHRDEFPLICPPTTGRRLTCEVMSAVSPEAVIAAVTKVVTEA